MFLCVIGATLIITRDVKANVNAVARFILGTFMGDVAMTDKKIKSLKRDELEIRFDTEGLDLLHEIAVRLANIQHLLEEMKQQEKEYWETWKQAKKGEQDDSRSV